MEDKKVKAGSVAVGICLSIIAILLVVIVYVFYNSITVKNNLQSEVNELKTSLEEKDKKVEELEDKISKVSDVIGEDESKETELDKDSELVKELYSIVLKYNNYDISEVESFSFYKDEKVTYDDLKDVEKLICVLNATNEEDYSKDVNIEDLELKQYQSIYKDYNVNFSKTKTADKYSNITDTLKRIFGGNAKIKKENYGLLSGVAEYYDDSYYLYMIEGGGLGETVYAYSEIKKAEKNGDYIYIYDKYICEDTTEAAMDMNGKNKFYTTSDKTKQIDVDESLFKRGEYDYNSETKLGYIGIDKSLEKILKHYEEKLNTYKHTFQKAEDGTYYWVSSEIYE